ncbi:unnamed protein product [Leptosia nina]|uniref:Uncharacterized protein n=1 Tax=Leptosia nina TaxID=320188 RepID=A0AAV1JSV7_9NEOP
MKRYPLIALFILHLVYTMCRAQGVSHIRVTTPLQSYAHGVDHPTPQIQRRSFHQGSSRPPTRNLRAPQATQGQFGYPRHKPRIPFYADEATRNTSPWKQTIFSAEKIPLLPQSPYKVDSADPESLWPIGLFIPPARLEIHRRSNQHEFSNPGSNKDIVGNFLDPYLLEGSNAVAAVIKAKRHGELYFHDIPHIQSLLDNQELRIENHLKPHRLGSIRHSWPFYRF